MSSSLPIYVVDAFTTDGNKPFTGNAAGVCLLEYDDQITDEQKQSIATEMNLSETAFVAFEWKKGEKLTPDSEEERRTLRWFTPTTEVPLCGHATVASAKIIQEIQLQGLDKTISFDSKFRGKLGATLCKNLIVLNFPSNPTHSINSKEYGWLNEMVDNILGSAFKGSDSVQDIQYSPGTKILFIRLKDEQAADGLRNVTPNFPALLAIDTGKFVWDVIVTVKGKGGGTPDFYSRFFAPWDGINEDPVTGLAHTVLTPYWAKELGRNGPLMARQHSTRGGDVQCTLVGDRVELAGQARVGLKGELFF